MVSEALWERLRARAKTDEAFRQELRADFAAVLTRETGMSAEELQSEADLLPDHQLADVSGGTSGNQFECPKCKFRFGTPFTFNLHMPICDLFT